MFFTFDFVQMFAILSDFCSKWEAEMLVLLVYIHMIYGATACL